MCGINGIISFSENIKSSNLKKMNSMLKHRGPDGEGIWISPNKKVGLGHRRLSIIDLSTKGSQPMCDNTQKIWITFNGEIYNYIELRKDLSSQGVKFKSKTDTEVIIYLYKKYGEKFVEKLRGMFAFCLVDLEKNKAILARDRIGKKPIIYSYNKSKRKIVFSSEISPVIETNEIKREIDLDGLNHYFSHVYFHVPAPYTIFKNVKKLEPACLMKIDLKSGKVKINKYWQPNFSKEIKGSLGKLKKEYLKTAKEAINIRERSDVPIGVLLSGGVDSSTITAMLKNKDVQTFAIGYDKNDPELMRARIVAKKFNTKHHEFTFEETGLSYLNGLISKTGEPFNVPSALYAMQLCEKIKKAGIKVVLNGNGVDEIFCGYSHHNPLLLLTKIMKIKKIIGTRLFSIFDVENPKNILSKFIRLMSIPDKKTKGEFYRIGQRDIANKLYSRKFLDGISNKDAGKLIDDSLNQTISNDVFKRHFYCDLSLANAHSMTYTADITGMANSLEIRSPFLDSEFVDFSGRVPNKFKIRSFFFRKYNKYLVKKVAELFLPKKIVYAKKMGFGYNIKIHKLLKKKLKNETEKRLFNGNLEKCGLFNMDYIRKVFNEHINNQKDNGILIMSLVCFEEWYRQFMK